MPTKGHRVYMSEEFFRKHGPLTFANILWSFRLCDEMSQKAYARKLRISPANLCDLEKGRKVPSPRRAAAIAKRIGLSETLLVEVALQDYLRKNKLHYRVSLAA